MIEFNAAKALKQPGGVFAFQYTGTPRLDGICFAGPLTLRASCSATADGAVRVKGDMSAAVRFECVRCLDRMERDIPLDFDEIFVKPGYAGDEDGYRYTGEEISLDKMVYDAILLSMPQQILCREDCRGLCPTCGANLNETECGCAAADRAGEESPFAALKNLFDGPGQ
jgi:uncharacterized protein